MIKDTPLYTQKEYNDAVKEARKEGYQDGYENGYQDGLTEHEG